MICHLDCLCLPRRVTCSHVVSLISSGSNLLTDEPNRKQKVGRVGRLTDVLCVRIAEISSQAFFADLRQPKENKPRLLTERRHQPSATNGTISHSKSRQVNITSLRPILLEGIVISSGRDGIDFSSTAREAFK